MSGYKGQSPMEEAEIRIWALKHRSIDPPPGATYEETLSLWERRLANIRHYPVRVAVKAALVRPHPRAVVSLGGLDLEKIRAANRMLAAHDRFHVEHSQDQ